MFTTLKFKYIVLSFVAVAVLSLSITVCVSYSSWVEADNMLSAQVQTGEWGETTDPPIASDDGMGYIDSNGNIQSVSDDGYFKVNENAENYFTQLVFSIKPSCKEQKIYLTLGGVNLATLTQKNLDPSVRTENDAFVINCGKDPIAYYDVVITLWGDGYYDDYDQWVATDGYNGYITVSESTRPNDLKVYELK